MNDYVNFHYVFFFSSRGSLKSIEISFYFRRIFQVGRVQSNILIVTMKEIIIMLNILPVLEYCVSHRALHLHTTSLIL